MRLPQQAAPIERESATAVPAGMTGALPQITECVGATVKSGKVCVDLPFGIGSVCIPVSGVPNLGSVKVCCTPYVFPPHVKCCVNYNGQDIVCKSFGA